MMAKKSEDTLALAGEQQAGNKRSALIGKEVMSILGQPRDFQRVQVRQLWDDRFRANIYVGTDAVSATVAASFFLVVDQEGVIVNSAPQIKRRF